MAHGEAVKSANPSRLVIRNIGLLLSGDLQHPILDADTVVADGDRIAAVGREADVDTSSATGDRRCQGHSAGPGLDRQPCASGVRRLDAAAKSIGVDRQLSSRWCHHNDFGR